ncbi:hypothetical protein ACFLZZ_03975 [Nanoarchaeota archaeon]
MKCDICGKEIEMLFLDKIKGTVVKINRDNKNAVYNVCNDCQKKYKDLKAELEKK